MIEAEGAVPERLCDICDAVFAHDVEGEAAGAGHDAGVVADAAVNRREVRSPSRLVKTLPAIN
jgi:hypothetical protein